MKKARAWLEAHSIDYRFHDYKKSGIDDETLRRWAKTLGWKKLLNTRGMMWRKLPQQTRDHIDEASAIALMRETPSIIKRPVLDTGSTYHLGFDPEEYARIFDV